MNFLYISRNIKFELIAKLYIKIRNFNSLKNFKSFIRKIL